MIVTSAVCKYWTVCSSFSQACLRSCVVYIGNDSIRVKHKVLLYFSVVDKLCLPTASCTFPQLAQMSKPRQSVLAGQRKPFVDQNLLSMSLDQHTKKSSSGNFCLC